MSFALSMDRVLNYVRLVYEEDDPDTEYNESDDTRKKKKQPNKLKILDNTRIHRLKSPGKGEGVVIVLGVMFVSVVIAYATFGGIINSPLIPGYRTGVTESADKNDAIFSDPPSAVDNYKDFILPKLLAPYSYILYLAPTIITGMYHGMVKIRVKCLNVTSVIVLHSSHHQINKFAVKAFNVTDTDDILVKSYSQHKQKEMLVIKLNRNLVMGYEYDIYIGFKGKLMNQSDYGMYLSNYRDGNGNQKKMISAVFSSGKARKVFPCFDEPQYKAQFQIIISHEKSFSVVSNTPIEKNVTVDSSERVETFFKKSLMSPYQFSFVIAQYTYKEIAMQGLKIRLYTPEGRLNETNISSKMIPKFLQYYKKMFGMKYAPSKLDFIPIQNLPSDTSESPGLIQISESLFLIGDTTHTLTQLENVAKAVAAGLVKQWFGCSVTMETWSDMWFTDSMAHYLGYMAVQHYYPLWDFKSQFYIDITNKALKDDESNFTGSIYTPNTNRQKILPWYHMRQYSLKGAALLAMYSDSVGATKFLQSVKSYTKKYRGHHSSFRKFLYTLMKGNPTDDRIDMMETWEKQPGFPLLSMSPVDKTGKYLFKQERFVFVDPDKAKKLPRSPSWWIPVSVRPTCRSTTVTHVLNKSSEIIHLRNCSTTSPVYKVNYGSNGFYRFKYNKKDISKLLQLLNTKHTALTAVDRANLLSDIFELARFNHEKFSVALDFTKYLSKEHHYVPYRIALSQLKDISDTFTGEKVEKCIKEYIKKQVRPVIHYMNSLKKHNHTEKKLIALLLREDVALNTDISISIDNMFLQWVLGNFHPHLPSHLRQLIIETGITSGSNYAWNSLFNYFKRVANKAEQNVLLKGLALAKSESFLRMLLQYAKDSPNIVMKEKLYIWTLVCQNKHGGKKLVMEALLKEQKLMSTILSDASEDFESFMISCLGSGETTAELDQVKKLVGDTSSLPIERISAKVTERIQHRMKQKTEIVAWFKNEIPGCI